MIFSSQCCLDGIYVLYPPVKYQIHICSSILHYRELMVFGAVIGGIYPSPPPMVRNVKNDLMVFIFNSSPNGEDKGV